MTPQAALRTIDRELHPEVVDLPPQVREAVSAALDVLWNYVLTGRTDES